MVMAQLLALRHQTQKLVMNGIRLERPMVASLVKILQELERLVA
jgi:hypothetical protein